MKLEVARFAPPGVNRATSSFLKNMGPVGSTLEITISALKPWVNATSTCKSIASEDSFKKFPKQKQ